MIDQMNERLEIATRLLAGLLSQSGMHSQQIHNENLLEALRLADRLIKEEEKTLQEVPMAKGFEH